MKHFSAKYCIKGVENFCNRPGSIVIPNKGEHKFTVGEEDSKKNLPTPFSLDRIHLYYSCIRIGKERRLLNEQLDVDAKAVNDLIAQNARVAQNQKEYNERYDALVSRYEETECRRDGVAEQINQTMIRRRKFERFIDAVTALPELYTEFDAGQWAGLVESMTVYDKDRIVWKLTCGMEIEG
ncbi:MAG: hypothetical protein IJI45_14950 [Anaerolineaceae bacterium]|nr:hypothetical protein [Anaerolineaceae bacterium]